MDCVKVGSFKKRPFDKQSSPHIPAAPNHLTDLKGNSHSHFTRCKIIGISF